MKAGRRAAAQRAVTGRDPAQTASDTPERKNRISLVTVFLPITADRPKKKANPIPACALVNAT